MCGFAGFIDITKSSSEELLKQTVKRMAETMRHRGPDDGGTWVDATCGIALGFQRLAILDLTPTGHQPMIAHNGRFVIVFNGEIYNHKGIKKELESVDHMPERLPSNPSTTRMIWNGHSDTEIMLEAIGTWGFTFSFVLIPDGEGRKTDFLHLLEGCAWLVPCFSDRILPLQFHCLAYYTFLVTGDRNHSKL